MAALDPTSAHTYEAEIQGWRQSMDERLRAETGWLTLTGLYWLHEGENTLGSDPGSDVVLPDSAPKHVGVIDFLNYTATLRITTDAEVTVDGVVANTILLHDDSYAEGASRVEIGSINFFIIERSDQYGVRVRDRNNPARQTFTGRIWFPLNADYHITGAFTRYPEPKTLDNVNALGLLEKMENPGYVDFMLNDQPIRLNAFDGGEDQLWFVFRDASPLTYRGGRFLYAPINADGTVTLDFNKAYNPPCVFTPYATCPLPPKQNILSFSLEAGEKMPPKA